MSKLKTIYVCSKCGVTTPRWTGQCTHCKEWNSFVEDVVDEKEEILKEKKASKILSEAVRLGETTLEVERLKTGIGEFDRVLGGGFVKDGLALLTGDPGVGKSTLTLQVAGALALAGKKVFYFSGEESASQVGSRSERIFGKKRPEIHFVSTTDLDEVLGITKKEDPDFVIVDSINTFSLDGVNGAYGSISQVKACTETLMQFFKRIGKPLLLIGHVTKGGEMAGPQVLAHLVDVVLYLEGEKYNHFRMLRGMKNRFGATSEIGVFEMEGEGLKEVTSPSSIFLEGRSDNLEGSSITVTLEGTRPFLVEIQALTTYTNFPYPKRVASGIDLNRLNIQLAILSKHCGVKLEALDVFVNTIGGFKLSEPSVDLAVCAAIFSSKNKKALPADAAFIGEVGLSGELRPVAYLEKRLKELEKLGFQKVYTSRVKKLPQTKLEVVQIGNIREILKSFSGKNFWEASAIFDQS